MLSALELRLATTELGVELDDLTGPLVGAIIGEAPGPNTSGKLPLFPLPTRSAGARLLGYSRMGTAEYLAKLGRKNLYGALVPWSAPEARRRAFEVWWWLRNQATTIRRVVLLGGRVAEAFGLDAFWTPKRFGQREITVVAIPHPSGKNRVYNDPAARARAGAEIRWAAGKRRTRPRL